MTIKKPETPSLKPEPLEPSQNMAEVSDPILDILKDEFNFEDDYLVLFSVRKCQYECPDC